MNFVQATSRLIEGLTLEDIAREIGVSHGLLRMSRLDPSNPAYRPPPAGWQAAVARLARRRSTELIRLDAAIRRKARGERRGIKRARRVRARTVRRKRSSKRRAR